MKKKLFVLLFLFSALYGYSQIKSGIVIGGGMGSISNVAFPDGPYIGLDGIAVANMQWSYKYKFDVSIGYRFRVEPQNKPFFYDIDVNVGLKRLNTAYTGGFFELPKPEDASNEVEKEYGYSDGNFQHIYYSFSVNPTWNYRIIRGLYAGAGIEPTLYAKEDTQSDEKWKFDLPLTAKIGYDLKFIDLSISYKHGLFDTMEHRYLNPAKFRNWQLSVFIPF